MTEPEWLECTDPTPMLEFLPDNASDRKLRLFACACCRRVWSLIVSEPAKRVVEVVELHADGHATYQEVAATAEDAILNTFSYDTGTYRANSAAEAVATVSNNTHSCEIVARCAALAVGHGGHERLSQVTLIRCTFGNPFHPVIIDPRWLTSTVVDLASAIYNEKAFDRMPILGDALMDAGCDNEEIIAHCRSEGAHVRGCWVVDLLLAKE
jgi:hypothetical protein